MSSSNLARAYPRISSPRVRFASMTDTGVVRERNDDSHVIADLTPDTGPLSTRIAVGDDGVLLAVADGMGGHADGDVASAIAVSEILRAMRRGGVATGTSADRVARAVEAAHESVCEAAAGSRGVARMGTTLTAVHVAGEHAHIAHVGDSRAYLIRGAEIARLTRDQTIVEIMIDGGLLEEGDRMHSPYAHQLAQVIGQNGRRLLVATSTVALRDGDVFVLCSDGLTNLVADHEIAAAVREGGPFEDTCRALVDLANLRGGDDNTTVVIAGVSGDLPRAALGETIASTHRIVRSFHGLIALRALADDHETTTA